MTSSPGKVLRSVGPKLVPFFKSVGVYFIVLSEQPSLLTACCKCLPIISLIIFILLYGVNLSNEYTFSRRILIGLVFSCLGDALLVWPSNFVFGMIMFALAQIMYISAFGFCRVNYKLGAILYVMCGIVINILLPGLKGILKIGVPIYTLLLGTMAWRALDRIEIFNQWTWRELCSGLGGISFAISDTLLGIHYFYSPILYPQLMIMLTYYAAQLGIALSAINYKETRESQK